MNVDLGDSNNWKVSFIFRFWWWNRVMHVRVGEAVIGHFFFVYVFLNTSIYLLYANPIPEQHLVFCGSNFSS